MDATFEGWAPDPFDAHEVRYFVDGSPPNWSGTDRWSFDDLPPRSTWPANLQACMASRPRTRPSHDGGAAAAS